MRPKNEQFVVQAWKSAGTYGGSRAWDAITRRIDGYATALENYDAEEFGEMWFLAGLAMERSFIESDIEWNRVKKRGGRK